MRSEMKSYKENQITERFQAHKEQWDVICYIVYVQTKMNKHFEYVLLSTWFGVDADVA